MNAMMRQLKAQKPMEITEKYDRKIKKGKVSSELMKVWVLYGFPMEVM